MAELNGFNAYKSEWIRGIGDKEFFAPFIIDNDSDYLENLKTKLNRFYDKVKGAGADDKCLDIIKQTSKKVTSSISCYYEGHIEKAYNIIKKIIKENKNNRYAVETVANNRAFFGDSGTEVQLYRARVSEDHNTYKTDDMKHVPFNKRELASNGRFSISGLPCLYLSNSSYGCWIEMRKPEASKFNVSPVSVDETKKIFNLVVGIRNLWNLEGNGQTIEENIHCWLKLMILMIATSYRVKNDNRSFKSEENFGHISEDGR